MANNIDPNQTRTLRPASNKRMPVTTFIRDTFFGSVITFPTKKIDVDVRKGSQNIAPFVAENVGGINIGRRGFITETYEPPRIAPQRTLTPEILEPRLPGETLHSAMTPEERQDYYLEQDAQEMEDMISRREELMCSELITQGKVTAKGYIDDNLEKYKEDVIDYQFENKTTLTSGAAWDQATAKRYADLETGVETVLRAGFNPGLCILGQKAWSHLRTDEYLLKMLDNRRIELGMIRPEFRTVDGNGLKYIGDLPDLGLQLMIYYAWYKDYDGSVKPIFPDDHVVIAPQGLGETLYGAITQLEKDERYHTYEGTRISKVFANQKTDTMTHRLSSKPLPKPIDIDSWYVLDVLG